MLIITGTPYTPAATPGHNRIGAATRRAMAGLRQEYLPSDGPVSWDVDAVPECPISGRYRTFASSESPGNADRFPLPHSIHRRSVNSGSIALAFAGGTLSDTERSSRNEMDPGFQAWVWWGAERHIGRAASHGRSGSFWPPLWRRIESKLR